MAEGEAEQAFLQAQTEAAEHNQTEGQQAGSSDSDDYDPSKTLQDEYSASVPDPKQDDENTPSAAPDQTIKSEPPPAAEPVQQPKTKTIGGFVVEDEDGDGDADEDEDGDDQKDADYEPPGVLDVEYVNTTSVNIPQQQTSPENPNQSSSMDINHFASTLSRYNHNPSPFHYELGLRVVSYLNGTRTLCLVFFGRWIFSRSLRCSLC